MLMNTPFSEIKTIYVRNCILNKIIISCNDMKKYLKQYFEKKKIIKNLQLGILQMCTSLITLISMTQCNSFNYILTKQRYTNMLFQSSVNRKPV